MGFKSIFKKIGQGALDIFKSDLGGILIGMYIPEAHRDLVNVIRKKVAELEKEAHPEYGHRGGDPREEAYREAAKRAEKMGIEYKPSDLYALIEIALKEQKGEALVRFPERSAKRNDEDEDGDDTE